MTTSRQLVDGSIHGQDIEHAPDELSNDALWCQACIHKFAQ